MKLGINAWCFPDTYPAEQVIALSAKAGFDTVEVNLGEETDGSYALSHASAGAILRSAKENNIAISSVSTSLHWKYPLTSADPKTGRKGMEVVVEMLKSASALGVDAVLVVPGLVDETVSYRQAYDRSQGALRELAAEAERRNVTICVENVWNKFLLSPLEMARFIDEIGSDRVQAYFDVGNVLQFSYPEYWIEILGARIKRVHVKDFRCDVGNMGGFTNLLEGDVAWSRVMAAFRAVKYDGCLTAELSPYRFHPEAIAEDTCRHMRAIVNA